MRTFKFNLILASFVLFCAEPAISAELVFKKPIKQLQVAETPTQLGVIALSTPTLEFTNVNVGATSSALSALIQNTGNAPFSFTALPSLASGSSSDFNNFVTNCSLSTALAPGNTCSVSIQFSPISTSAQSGSISISTSVGATTIALTGTGIGVPNVAYSSNGPLNFGSINVGQSSAAQTYTVTSSGSAPLFITSLPTLSGTDAAMFNISNNSCATGAELTPGSSCSFDIKFAPNAEKLSAEASVAIVTSVGSKNLALSGTGVGIPSATYSSNGPLSFGTVYVGQSSSAQTYTVTSSGSASLSITSAPSLTGANAAMFSISNNTCTAGATLVPNASCSFNLTFTPTATVSASASVALTSSVGTKSVSLTATGATAQLNASGGLIYTPGDGYKYHVFTGGIDGFVVTSNISNISAEVLIVAGGGGGGQGKSGSLNPGGGGGGGVITNTLTPTAQTYTVAIGAGGVAGGKGGDSSFAWGSTIWAATGGGWGAGNNNGAPGVGGSGGGALGSGPTGTTRYGASGTTGQGNAGGIGYGTGFGGGGGGAGAAGGNGNTSTSTAGAGGAGLCFTRFTLPAAGISGCFGGGGGGGGGASNAPGGVGGGGTGMISGAGAANTGGGGGGGQAVGSTVGGAGGSGVVIVRYPY